MTKLAKDSLEITNTALKLSSAEAEYAKGGTEGLERAAKPAELQTKILEAEAKIEARNKFVEKYAATRGAKPGPRTAWLHPRPGRRRRPRCAGRPVQHWRGPGRPMIRRSTLLASAAPLALLAASL